MTTKCSGTHQAGRPEVPLPILDLGNVTGGKVRKSRTGRWRAGVLIALNALMAAHLVQWWLTGRTVSPIEPSETVYTLMQGQVNAGLIFFAAALIATLIFGRFVCGWGCHVVALQDLCAWIMKKMGVRPKAFRSRLLIWVPLIAALYMFVWPIVYRVWRSATYDETVLPTFTNHLTTTEFWKTFPSVAVAIPFLLICGFGAVYFLGAKGFCTYGCPYGGLFGLADRFAPGRIRVTDACEHCGHCTAVCTSNVQVHAEVRDYGMVIDPGCMKCMDCVSVCPNQALYFGFAPVVDLKQKAESRKQKTGRKYDLTLGEEVLVAGAFAAAFFAFRGLYETIPFLMALGTAGMFAFGVFKLRQLFRPGAVLIQNLRLKTGGKVTGLGWTFRITAAACLLLVVHSLFIQYHAFWGQYHFLRTPSEEIVLADDYSPKALNGRARYDVDRGLRHFEFCEGWGLLDSAETKMRLAWLYLVAGRPGPAAARLYEVVRLRPSEPKSFFYLGRALQLEREPQHDLAIRAFDDALRLDPTMSETRFHRGVSLAATGRLDAAVADWRSVVHDAPTHPHAWHNLGGALRQMGRLEEAAECFARALDSAPNDASTHFFLAVTLTQMGRADEGLTHFQRAVDLDPKNGEYHWQLGLSLAEAGRTEEAQGHLQQAVALDPRLRDRR